MDDISFRALQKFKDNKPMSKQETWVYLHTKQIIPGILNTDFDTSFKIIVDQSLISADIPLSTTNRITIYKITDPGRLAYKNEKKIRRKSLIHKYPIAGNL